MWKKNFCAHELLIAPFLCRHQDLSRNKTSEVSGKQAIPPILFYPSSISPGGHPGGGGYLAECYSVPASPLRRESAALSREPIPPALLPVGHSPSRRSRLRRWWALTPPFQPSPRPCERGWFALCCSCRHPRRDALTCFFVRQPCPASLADARERNRESGSSSHPFRV